MKKLTLMALLLLLPQLAVARVYMCVDRASGQTSFTDKACDTANKGEEVLVRVANLNSAQSSQARAKPKAWRSQADTRKTGTEYSAERRTMYESKATAGTQ